MLLDARGVELDEVVALLATVGRRHWLAALVEAEETRRVADRLVPQVAAVVHLEELTALVPSLFRLLAESRRRRGG